MIIYQNTMNSGFATRLPFHLLFVWLQMTSILLALQPAVVAAETGRAALRREYASEIRPLLIHYCHRCHGTETTEGDVDLAAIIDVQDLEAGGPTWEKVRTMLEGNLMPPEDEQQPTSDERKRLQQWVHGVLVKEKQAPVGDPGRVILRRLNNAEYTYTIRDLTRVESLEPVREFPPDSAAGEGFTNVGNALVMSPALISKYLSAAKEIAGHAVLLPNDFRFSAFQTSRDWTD